MVFKGNYRSPNSLIVTEQKECKNEYVSMSAKLVCIASCFYIIASNFKFELSFGIANDLWSILPCNGNAVRTIAYIDKDNNL